MGIADVTSQIQALSDSLNTLPGAAESAASGISGSLGQIQSSAQSTQYQLDPLFNQEAQNNVSGYQGSLTQLVGGFMGVVGGALGVASGFVGIEREGTLVDRLNKTLASSTLTYNSEMAKYNQLVAEGKGGTEAAAQAYGRAQVALQAMDIAHQRINETQQQSIISWGQVALGVGQLGMSVSGLLGKMTGAGGLTGALESTFTDLGSFGSKISLVGFLTNPVILILFALVAAYLALHYNIGGVTTSLEGFGKSIGDQIPALRPLLTFIQDLGAQIGIGSKDVGTARDELIADFSAIGKAIVSLPSTIEKGIGDLAGFINTNIVKPAEDTWGKFVAFLQNPTPASWDAVVKSAQKGIQPIEDWITKAFVPAVQSSWSFLVTTLGDAKNWTLVAAGIQTGLGQIASWIQNNVIKPAESDWAAFAKIMMNPILWTDVAGAISNGLTQIAGWIQSNVITPAEAYWADFAKIMMNPTLWTDVAGAISNGLGQVADWINTNVVLPAEGYWIDFTAWLGKTDVWATIVTDVENTLKPLQDWFGNVFIPALEAAWNGFVNFFSGGLSWLGGQVSGALGSLSPGQAQASSGGPPLTGASYVNAPPPTQQISSSLGTVQALAPPVTSTGTLSPVQQSIASNDAAGILRQLLYQSGTTANAASTGVNYAAMVNAPASAAVLGQEKSKLGTFLSEGGVPTAKSAQALGYPNVDAMKADADAANKVNEAYMEALKSVQAFSGGLQQGNQLLNLNTTNLDAVSKAYNSGNQELATNTAALMKNVGEYAPLSAAEQADIRNMQNVIQANTTAANVMNGTATSALALRTAYLQGTIAANDFVVKSLQNSAAQQGQMAQYQSFANIMGVTLPSGFKQSTEAMGLMVSAQAALDKGFGTDSVAVQAWRDFQIKAMSDVENSGTELFNAIAKGMINAKGEEQTFSQSIATLPKDIQDMIQQVPAFGTEFANLFDFGQTLEKFKQGFGLAMREDAAYGGTAAVDGFESKFGPGLSAMATKAEGMADPDMKKAGQDLAAALAKGNTAGISAALGEVATAYKTLGSGAAAQAGGQATTDGKGVGTKVGTGVATGITSQQAAVNTAMSQLIGGIGTMTIGGKTTGGISGQMGAEMAKMSQAVQAGMTVIIAQFNTLQSDIIGDMNLIKTSMNDVVTNGFVNSLQKGTTNAVAFVAKGFQDMMNQTGVHMGGMVTAMQNFVNIGLTNSLEKGVSAAVTLVDKGFLDMMNQVGTHLGGMVTAVQKFVTDGLVNSLEKGANNALSTINTDFGAMLTNVNKDMTSMASDVSRSVSTMISTIARLVTAINAVPTTHHTTFTATDNVSSVASSVRSAINAVPTSHNTSFTSTNFVQTVFVSPSTNTNVTPLISGTANPSPATTTTANVIIPVYLDSQVLTRAVKKNAFNLSGGVT